MSLSFGGVPFLDIEAVVQGSQDERSNLAEPLFHTCSHHGQTIVFRDKMGRH